MKHLLLTTILLLTWINALHAQMTYYVKSNGTGDGSSWGNASANLQNIIDNASNGDSIFVAGGSYQPTASGSSFTMKEGVKIYGSFAGTENHLADRNLRSGDTSFLKGNGSSVIVNNNNGLTAAAVLDGFVITGGEASEGGGMYNNFVFPNSSMTLSNIIFANNLGGGLFGSASPIIKNVIFIGNIVDNNSPDAIAAGMTNYGGAPELTNVFFINNNAGNGNYGGGMYNYDNTIKLTNVIFANNSSALGGGMLNYSGAYGTLTNVIFSNNTATNGGGGIYNQLLTLTLNNVTFSGNSGGSGSGGAIYNETYDIMYSSNLLLINNSVFWGNTASEGPDIADIAGGRPSKLSYCYTQSSIAGTGNIQGTSDPFLDDSNPAGADGIYMTADDGLNISASSGAYNAGDNDSIPTGITTDITGAPRIVAGIVDMGAYENQDAALPLTLLNFTGVKQNNTVQLKWQTTNEVNTAYFNIQRSTDAVHFGNIGIVSAANKNGVNDYSYNDNITGISVSTLYYRLREVDMDGRVDYSNIVSINSDETGVDYTIYPNPSEGFFNLISTRPEDLKGADISIIDLSGQVVLNQSLLASGYQKISISSLAKGMYIVKIIKPTGVVTRKLLKE